MVEIVNQYAPGMVDNPAASMVKGMSVASALGMAGSFLPAETIATVRERLEAL